jgi:pSer/pThr/pTyr-binding forkhead associated (FHA) protein
LPSGWLVVNRQPGTTLEVNAWPMDQRLLRPGDVLHCGATWLAFDAPLATAEPMPPVPGNWRRVVGPGTATVQSAGSVTEVQTVRPGECTLVAPDGRVITSTAEPLRIGTTRLCQIRMEDPDVAPVHAMVAWQTDGPHLYDLSGTGVRLADGRTGGNHLLHHGDAIRLGSNVVPVRIKGDATSVARAWLSRDAADPRRMAVTIVAGPQKGQTALLPVGQALVLGRHSDCDLCIAADPYISRRHLELTAGAGQLEVRDLGSRHGFAVGPNTSTTTAVARPGDVVKVGQSYLLVHMELT